MTDEGLVVLLALAAMLAYGVLAGADFGGGIWDLLARGPRAAEHRGGIAAAIGPVWEANHVWLIFLIVLLFSAFPAAHAALSIALFWPFHLALVGIVLRGAAFVFRAYGRAPSGVPDVWPQVFGVASVFAPFAFGACLGAIAAGDIRVVEGAVQPDSTSAWLQPFPLATGLLALCLCAYLAAVYLTLETRGEVREDFRRRALLMSCVAGTVSVGTLILAIADAPHLWQALLRPPAVGLVAVGSALAPASGFLLWRRRFMAARVLAAAQVGFLLAGWAAAQWPYIIYPDVPMQLAAAPEPTIRALLWTTPFGMALLAPSLAFLFWVFKGQRQRVD